MSDYTLRTTSEMDDNIVLAEPIPMTDDNVPRYATKELWIQEMIRAKLNKIEDEGRGIAYRADRPDFEEDRVNSV